MGSWGTGLFADDMALDIKDEYIKYFREGKSPEEIVALLKKEFQIQDNNDDDFFWVCLSVVQWDHGHLTAHVKERALTGLSCLWDPGVWERPADMAKRKALEEKVKTKLESPQPAAKKPPKFRAKKSKWRVGEIYSFQFMDFRNRTTCHKKYAEFSFKYGAFCVVGMELVADEERGGVLDEWPVVMIYDSITDERPTLKELDACPMIMVQGDELGYKDTFYSTLRGQPPAKWMIDLCKTQYLGATNRFCGIELPTQHALDRCVWSEPQLRLGDARLNGWPHVTREDGTLM